MLPLKLQVIRWCVAGIFAILILIFKLPYFSENFNSFYWGILSSACWLWVCWQLWIRLPLNKTGDSPLYPRLGIANQLTLLRGWLIALTAGFLLQPSPQNLLAWVPGLFYVFAVLLDRIDGWLARVKQQTTDLGTELDTVYDALGLLLVPLLAVSYGKLHWSFLFVSLAYYFFCTGIKWRQKRELPIYSLLPSNLRRTLAGFQMGFVAMALLPCFSGVFTKILGVLFMLPLLIGFVVDWLVVSGRITTWNSVLQQQVEPVFFNRLEKINWAIIQPIIRIILCVLLLVQYSYWQEVLSFGFFVSIYAIALLMILPGVSGRLGALLLLLLFLLAQTNQLLTLELLFIFAACVSLMLFGTGKFSLWQGDSDWVNRRDGESV